MPATIPADVVNRALDECGLEEIGDVTEGSPAAKAAARIYEPTLRQLLSAAHWNFARKDIRLDLIGDATGTYNGNTAVPSPWRLMYDWPVDCVHARFVPRTSANATINNTIFGTAGSTGTVVCAPTLGWSSPAPFLVSNAPLPNDASSQWYLTEGHDPESTRIILTNQFNAHLVYTGLMWYPDAWDPLFEQAMVAVLAARLAMPLIKDRKEAIQVRRDNIGIAKQALDTARVRDGDEGWTIADYTPDWIRARTSGIAWYGPGVLYMPWMNMPFIEDAGGVY